MNGGCEKVAMHPSSKWLGIPVAYFGFGAYLSLAVLAAIRGLKGLANTRNLSYLGFAISASGMVVSIFLTFYALSVIRATCLWCMASLATMFLSFFAHAMLAQKDPEPTPGSGFDLKFGSVLAVIALLGTAGEGYVMQKGGIPIRKVYENAPVAEFMPPDAHFLGDKDAPVTIVEFGDLLCPACKAHYPDLVDMATKSGGRIKYVFRHYPMYQIKEHRMSYQGAVLSEIAAEKGKFWDYVTEVYQFPNQEIDSVQPFADVLKEVGIKPEPAVERSVNVDDAAFKRVYADLQDGSHLGARGTPTFFVLANDPSIKPKACNFNELVSLIDAEPYKSLMAHAAKK